MNIVFACCGFLDFNTAAYAGTSEVLSLQYTDESGDIICSFSEAAFLEASADAIEQPAIILNVPVANAAVVVAANADLTTGDSPIYIRAWYYVVDLDFGDVDSNE